MSDGSAHDEAAKIREAPRILLVEDEDDAAEMLGELLRGSGYRTAHARDMESARARLRDFSPHAVLCDVVLDKSDGLALAAEIRSTRPTLPIVAMTGYASVERAVTALRLGLTDFLVKPFGIAEVDRALRRVLRIGADLEALVGESEAMVELRSSVAQLAPSETTVLIEGESGTGKELVAQTIHQNSPRADGPLVSVNCAAIAPTLLESELFGHVAGAFTDAETSRDGLFAEANGGTLFLDEVGELPLALQPKLLRALQERRVRPVGAFDEMPIDVRIVAATNRDLEKDVEAGRFRADLFYRLNVVRVRVPPLRERGSDVLLLAELFIRRLERARNRALPAISEEVRDALRNHSWPGNVRELQNCLERAVTLSRGDWMELDALPEAVRKAVELPAAAEPQEEDGEPLSLRDLERRYVEHILRVNEGNKTAAARVLGVDRRTLRRMLQRWSTNG
ncbi:MAG: Fis family transcriptional regulator [Sandaracinus sp.]|nr:Fis family transcriptional regulator [Sandaracinus sp.]